MNQYVKNVDYIRRMKNSYSISRVDGEHLTIFEVNMLKNNAIQGFLPMEFVLNDGESELWYDITGLKSLDEMMRMNKIHIEELCSLFKALNKVYEEIAEYMLDEKGVSLKVEDVYFSMDEKEVFFKYLPLEGEMSSRIALKELIYEMIKWGDYKDTDYMNRLLSITEMLDSETVTMAMIIDKAINGSGDGMRDRRNEDIEIGEEYDAMKYALSEEYENELKAKETIEENVKEDVSNTIKKLLKKRFNKKKSEVEGRINTKIRDYTTIKPELKHRRIEEDDLIITPELAEAYDTKTEYVEDMQYAEESNEEEEDNQVGALVVSGKKGRNKEEFRLVKPVSLIGKKEGSVDVMLKDNTVSRIHAIVERTDDSYYLQDLNSMNGTYVNGEILPYKDKVKLVAGDEVAFGKMKLNFRLVK